VAFAAQSNGLSYNGQLSNQALTGTSPCINKGNPSGTYPSVDIAGNPRIFNSVIDIGAYELQGYYGVATLDHREAISLFPNPACDFVWLDGEYDLKVLSVGGLELIAFKKAKEIDVSRLPAGLYILQIQSKGQTRHQKLLVER
jgi:hypothetical protein